MKTVPLAAMALTALLLAGCGMVPASDPGQNSYGMSNPASSSSQQPSTAPATPTTPQAPTTQPAGNGHHSDPHHGTAAAAATLTEQDAVQIALQHAGVAESDTTFLHVEKDRENSGYVYEIEFYVGAMEYQYEIDAATGTILDFEREKD